MAQILAFDRAARCHAELTHDLVLRRCRIAAITKGCNNAGRATVEASAKDWLAGGMGAHDVIQRAANLAMQLAKPTSPEAA